MARMILSSLTPSELVDVISSGNDRLLKTVKGIGLKTAQRIIVELRDKISLIGSSNNDVIPGKVTTGNISNEVMEEAVSALTMLGFQVSASQKVVVSILKEDPSLPVEKVIKMALKQL